jgi:hypothetical protein
MFSLRTIAVLVSTILLQASAKPILNKDIDLTGILPELTSPIDIASTVEGLDIAPLKRQVSESGSLLADVEAWLSQNTRNSSLSKARRDPLGLSLPPLIPSIPGVTEVLAENQIPLPVLQLPTPPLESEPFPVNTEIRPKKIGYFWTGAGDNKHKDFLVGASLDDVSLPSTAPGRTPS